MRTSIVIVTFNQIEETRRCLASIRKHTQEGSYELIFVDNGSTDGTADWLREQPDVKLIENEKNEGFAKGVNKGARAATGDRLLLLNNDTAVTPRWLEQLTIALESADDIAAVGPVANLAGYGQSIPTKYKTPEELERFAEAYNVSTPSAWKMRLKLIGFCLLIKRKVWEEVGELDESFGIGNFEDDDWSWRARRAGYRLLLCSDTFIHHEGSASFRHDEELLRRLLRENSVRFEKKWGFHPAFAMNIRTDALDALEPYLKGKKGLKVLEIGCGCGGTLLELKNRYPDARLFGFEAHAPAAEAASLLAEKVWSIPDPSEWESEDGEYGYDVVLLHDIFPTVVSPEALGTAAGLLKEGGALLATVPNRLHFNHVKAYLAPQNRLIPYTMLSEAETRRRFEEAGYEGVAIAKTADVIDPDAVEALLKLMGRGRRDDFSVLYYLVRAVRGAATKTIPLVREAPAAKPSGKETALLQAQESKAQAPQAQAPQAQALQAQALQAQASKAHVPQVPGPAASTPAPAPSREPAASPSSASSVPPAAISGNLPASQHDVVFTGERLILNDAVLGSHPDVYAEHLFRYKLAQNYCQGMLVLDAACGAGYGTRMLKDAGALEVAGIDIDPVSIQLANRDYSGTGVVFQEGNVLALPFRNGVFDLVVSFETIEHVPDGSEWLKEAARVLKPGGRLIISTPNREVTNPNRQFGQSMSNPYHCFEYSLGEFVGELSALYDIERIYGQTFVGQNRYVAPDWPDIAEALGASPSDLPGYPPEQAKYFAPASLGRIKNARPTYAVAVCRKKG
ncbi:methyltransferase domain-containing protein [Cohnella sp. AR92]|uniref:methyltransferase domain-containing protein n=1 Tax=Cohnella sp. AR92 TaxID=648716 RepID=UPI000F8C8735|nr:methyltransferase domain-containing protein [Cohnella sp. AR92]RUS46467.1 methyltransferase domain-containing protein [Cohnella sp. AR92]